MDCLPDDYPTCWLVSEIEWKDYSAVGEKIIALLACDVFFEFYFSWIYPISIDRLVEVL